MYKDKQYLCTIFYKTRIVMEQHPIKINKVQIRNLQIEDYVQLSQSFTRVYSDGSDVFWTREQIQKLIKIFPEGQIVTVVSLPYLLAYRFPVALLLDGPVWHLALFSEPTLLSFVAKSGCVQFRRLG